MGIVDAVFKMMSSPSPEGSLRSRKTESGRPRVIIATLSGILILVLIGVATYFIKVYGFDKGTDCQSDFFENKPYNVCQTEGCKLAASYFESIMNLASGNPCKDFFDFVCGGWIQKNKKLHKLRKISDDVKIKLKEIMMKLLASKGKNPRPFVEEAKTFYQRCLQINLITERKGISKIVKDFGGFPLYDKSTYNESMPWYIRTARVIKRFGRHDTGFSQGTIINFEISPMHGLSFTKPNLFYKFGTSLAAASINVKNEICTFLRGSCSKGEEFAIVKQIAGMLRFGQRVETIAIHTATGQFRRKDTTVGEIDREYPVLHIRDFLSEMFYVTNASSVTMTTYMYQYFGNLSLLINNTPAKNIHNFIGWGLFNVLGYNTLKPNNKNETTLSFMRERNHDKRDSQKENFCFQRIMYPYKYAITRLLVDHNTFTDDMKTTGLTVLEDLRKALVQMISENAWLSDNTKKKLSNKIKLITTDVGYPSWLKMDDKFDRQYKIREDIKKPSVIEMIRAVYSFHASDILIRVQYPETNYGGWREMGPITFNAGYSTYDNHITIPATQLAPPTFWSDATKALMYGSGWVIAHELSHAIDSGGLRHDQYGNFDGDSVFTLVETQTFNIKEKCIIDQFNKIKEPITKKNLNGFQTREENTADYVGLRALYRAYLLSGEQRERLPGKLEVMDDKKLFFITAASYYCSYFDRNYMEHLLRTDEHSPNPFRTYMAATNMKEFSKAFGCKKDDPMNVKKKCTIW